MRFRYLVYLLLIYDVNGKSIEPLKLSIFPLYFFYPKPKKPSSIVGKPNEDWERASQRALFFIALPERRLSSGSSPDRGASSNNSNSCAQINQSSRRQKAFSFSFTFAADVLIQNKSNYVWVYMCSAEGSWEGIHPLLSLSPIYLHKVVSAALITPRPA